MKLKTGHLVTAGAALASVLLLGGLAYWFLVRPPSDTPAALKRRWAGLGVDKPNVVLITLDTTRADHLGCYGYPTPTTPNADALAARGVLFAHASSVAPLTQPAHSSILTGMQPTYHGVRVNGTTALGQSQETLAEVLVQARLRDGGLRGRFRARRAVGAQSGLRALRRPLRPQEVQAPRPRNRAKAGQRGHGRSPGLAGGPQAGSLLRLDPSLRRPHPLRASRAVPLEVQWTRSRRPLRRRDRFRRRAGGTAASPGCGPTGSTRRPSS